jgi:hypothetical protein
MITRSKSNQNKHKKCSLCKVNGHDIRNCSDIRIQELINEKTQLYNRIYKKPDNYNRIREWLSSKSPIELSTLAVKLNVPTTYPKHIKISCLVKEMIYEILSIQIDYILCKIFTEPTNNINQIVHYEKRKDICGRVIDIMRKKKLYEPVFFIIQILNKIDLKENPSEFMNYVRQNIMFTSLENKQYFYACYFVCEYMIDTFLPKEKKWNIVLNEFEICNSCKTDKQINECPICFENYSIENKVYTNCNHSFCSECIKKHLDTFLNKPVPTCPICRRNITILSIYSTYSKNLLL